MEKHTQPADIERTSMKILTEELARRGLTPPEETAPVVKRVIHTTADFDYAETLAFTPNAVSRAVERLREGGAVILTDTNMARSGISKPTLEKLGARAECFMACPEVAQAARQGQTTRAAAAVDRGTGMFAGAIFAVGNAPTALFRLAEHMEQGYRPALVVGVPVGFVNVVEAKEQMLELCRRLDVPAIVALGRKGGSNVAAAICNALLYSAAQTLDPSARGWN